jgi:hypothetical protein
MNHRQTLQAVDTIKGLALLGTEGTGNGSYISFPCPKCHEKAVFKAYGEKKNVWYCPKCKAAGNIVSLAMESTGVQWEEAKQILGKAIALAMGGTLIFGIGCLASASAKLGGITIVLFFMATICGLVMFFTPE